MKHIAILEDINITLIQQQTGGLNFKVNINFTK